MSHQEVVRMRGRIDELKQLRRDDLAQIRFLKAKLQFMEDQVAPIDSEVEHLQAMLRAADGAMYRMGEEILNLKTILEGARAERDQAEGVAKQWKANHAHEIDLKRIKHERYEELRREVARLRDDDVRLRNQIGRALVCGRWEMVNEAIGWDSEAEA